MLPPVTVPASWAGLLAGFRSCFTAPSFATFCALVGGLVQATGRRTVCAMLAGAGLSRRWSHDRAHFFFARARWDVTEVGLILARLVVARLVPAGAAITVAVDDSLFKRWGPKVFGRAWQHDGAAKSPRKLGSGVCFVVAGIIVALPFRIIPLCLPVLACLYRPAPKPAPGRGSSAGSSAPAAPTDPAGARRLTLLATRVQRARTKLQHAQDRKTARAIRLAANGGWLPGSVPDLDTPIAQAEQALTDATTAHQQALAEITEHGQTRRTRTPKPKTKTKTKTEVAGSYPTKTELAIAMVTQLAAAFPDRTIHVVADAAYHSRALRHLPDNVTWTFRLAKTAVLHQRPPAHTGQPGRPKLTGPRLGTPTDIAATATWQPTTIHRHGEDHPATITVIDCRWHNSLGTVNVRLTLIRNTDTTTGYDLALLSTDPTATGTDLTNRYATRWTIETCFRDTREHLGAGQPHNRTQTAVHRTIPLQLFTYSLITIWYTTTGHHPDDLTRRRWLHPWYQTKTTIAFADMITKLRHTLTETITEYPTTHPDQPTPNKTNGGCPTCKAATA